MQEQLGLYLTLLGSGIIKSALGRRNLLEGPCEGDHAKGRVLLIWEALGTWHSSTSRAHFYSIAPLYLSFLTWLSHTNFFYTMGNVTADIFSIALFSFSTSEVIKDLSVHWPHLQTSWGSYCNSLPQHFSFSIVTWYLFHRVIVSIHEMISMCEPHWTVPGTS